MKNKQGKEIPEGTIEEWANQFESGEWPEGRTLHVGRPALKRGERTRVLTFRLPETQATAFEAKAKSQGRSKSEVFRAFVSRYLAD